jgi:S-adenosylmethionine uptake transporter
VSAAHQAAWALVSAFAFTVMSAGIKFGFAHYGLFELVFWRNVLGALAIGGWAALTSRRVTTRHWPMHLRRCAAGTTSMVLWFASLAVLPLPTATTLGNTAPLFAAAGAAIAARWRGDPPDARLRLLYTATACGFIGVALALRPTMDGATLAGFAAGLLSGLLASFVFFEMRTLGAAGEPSWRVVFWFSSVACTVALVGVLAGGGFSSHSPAGVGWLLTIAGSALVGQLSMTRAFAGPATLLAANLQYANIAFALAIGALAFGDVLTVREAIGVIVIAASSIWATWLSRSSAARPAARAPT